MTIAQIQSALEKALLHNGNMPYALYEFELEELVDECIASRRDDNDAYLFAVTEHSGDVAMLLVDASEQLYINEAARTRLQELWKEYYDQNIQQFIPIFAQQLNDGSIPINGVKVV